MGKCTSDPCPIVGQAFGTSADVYRVSVCIDVARGYGQPTGRSRVSQHPEQLWMSPVLDHHLSCVVVHPHSVPVIDSPHLGIGRAHFQSIVAIDITFVH